MLSSSYTDWRSVNETDSAKPNRVNASLSWRSAPSVVRTMPDDKEYTTTHLLSHYDVKYPYISTDIAWRVFHILTTPVPYTFVSANRRNNEARVHIAKSYMCYVEFEMSMSISLSLLVRLSPILMNEASSLVFIPIVFFFLIWVHAG